MMRLVIMLLLWPALAWAQVSGVDDVSSNLSEQEQKTFDDAFTTYYEHPSVSKINTIFDLMAHSDLLRKKTAWSPMVGFLTVIFENNKEHVFDWISRNDYNSYAQDVIITALVHAHLNETGYLFAQVSGWREDGLQKVRQMNDDLDFKHLTISLPGHIDALWGAFFASGDLAYLNQIIDALYTGTNVKVTRFKDPVILGKALPENKKLVEMTLSMYAATHPLVRDTLKARLAGEQREDHKAELENVLGGGGGRKFLVIVGMTVAAFVLWRVWRRKKKNGI